MRDAQRRMQSPPLARLHIGEEQLETIAQRPHVWVLVFLQLKRLRDDLDRPTLQLGIQAGFEAEVKVSRMLGIDAEGVVAAFGIRFHGEYVPVSALLPF